MLVVREDNARHCSMLQHKCLMNTQASTEGAKTLYHVKKITRLRRLSFFDRKITEIGKRENTAHKHFKLSKVIQFFAHFINTPRLMTMTKNTQLLCTLRCLPSFRLATPRDETFCQTAGNWEKPGVNSCAFEWCTWQKKSWGGGWGLGWWWGDYMAVDTHNWSMSTSSVTQIWKSREQQIRWGRADMDEQRDASKDPLKALEKHCMQFVWLPWACCVCVCV